MSHIWCCQCGKKWWCGKGNFVTIMFSEARRRPLFWTPIHHHRGLLWWPSCPYPGSIASSTSSSVARSSWKLSFSWVATPLRSPSRRSTSSFRSSSTVSSNHSTSATSLLSASTPSRTSSASPRLSLSRLTWRRTGNNSATNSKDRVRSLDNGVELVGIETNPQDSQKASIWWFDRRKRRCKALRHEDRRRNSPIEHHLQLEQPSTSSEYGHILHRWNGLTDVIWVILNKKVYYIGCYYEPV